MGAAGDPPGEGAGSGGCPVSTPAPAEDSEVMSTTSDTAANPAATALQGRARRLRMQAVALPPLLAETYRRRAAELDVQAWLEAVLNPPIDLRINADPWAA